MAWFMVVLLRVVLLLMLVAAFAMGIVALARNRATNETLINPKLQQPALIGGTPTIAVTAGSATFQNAGIGAGSNDSSGVITGDFLAPLNLVTFQVTFSKAFPLIPTSVILMPTNQVSQAQHTYVTSITATGFTFASNKADSQTNAGVNQWYYLVL